MRRTALSLLLLCSATLTFSQPADKLKNLSNPVLAVKLDSIFAEDQQYRQQIDEIEKKFGQSSKEMKAHWQLINEKDARNLIIVKDILDKYGWLGKDAVGNKGNQALFLVIQHADLQTQLHYLPIMQEAVKKGNALGKHLALLEDRTAIGQGKKQIYGSQIGSNPTTGLPYVLPLIDPDQVDQRRAKVGLQPIAEYVQLWNIKWDLEQYKRDLAAIEANK